MRFFASLSVLPNSGTSCASSWHSLRRYNTCTKTTSPLIAPSAMTTYLHLAQDSTFRAPFFVFCTPIIRRLQVFATHRDPSTSSHRIFAYLIMTTLPDGWSKTLSIFSARPPRVPESSDLRPTRPPRTLLVDANTQGIIDTYVTTSTLWPPAIPY